MALTRMVLGLAAAIALADGAAAQQKPDKIVIGYLNLVNAQLVTKSLGLHEKEMGVPIEWVKFGSGGDVNRAVAAGHLAFGGVGNPPATIGAGRGLGYKGIFVLNMLGPVEFLVVRTSKGIAKPQDLVGKTMAAPFGSTTHYLTIAYLRASGVDPTSVKLLDMSPSDAAAAWISRRHRRRLCVGALAQQDGAERREDHDGQRHHGGARLSDLGHLGGDGRLRGEVSGAR